MRLVWLGALGLGLSAVGSAMSFGGSDWTFSATGVFQVRTSLANLDNPVNDSGPVTVTQTTAGAFSFPYSVGGLSGQGDFTVSGMTVTDVNTGKTTDPISTSWNGVPVTVRFTYPTWSLVGTVTGVNAGVTDAFGARAYAVAGAPVTVTGIKTEVLTGSFWVDLGSQSRFELSSWSMVRAVPEPGMMMGLAVGVGALLRRRRAMGSV